MELVRATWRHGELDVDFATIVGKLALNIFKVFDAVPIYIQHDAGHGD